MKLHYNFETYPQLTHPNGFLPDDKRAQACWFFYLMAQSAKETVGDGPESQIILEEDMWMDTHYENQARSVAAIYQLESPDEFLKFFKFVEKQAIALSLPRPDPRYMRPLRKRIIT